MVEAAIVRVHLPCALIVSCVVIVLSRSSIHRLPVFEPMVLTSSESEPSPVTMVLDVHAGQLNVMTAMPVGLSNLITSSRVPTSMAGPGSTGTETDDDRADNYAEDKAAQPGKHRGSRPSDVDEAEERLVQLDVVRARDRTRVAVSDQDVGDVNDQAEGEARVVADVRQRVDVGRGIIVV